MDSLLSIDVSLSSWPQIALDISQDFYIIAWICLIFTVIILFNLALISTGALFYGLFIVVKMVKNKML